MPRIKRWFHVSHEINSDEEVWELTDRWKAWGLRVWLQLLSIGDRNEGRIKGDLALLSRSMSRLWDSNSRRYNSEWRANEARIMLEWMQDKGWIRIESDAIVICNWLIYNPRRELLSSPPNHPILTNPIQSFKEEEKKKNKRAQAPLVLPDWMPIEAWNGFTEMRKKLRKPLTDRAVQLTISDLAKLQEQGNDPAAVLDQSVSHSWVGVFPLKTNGVAATQVEGQLSDRTLRILRRGL